MKRVLSSMMVLVVLLALAAEPGAAQGPEPTEPITAQAAVGTAFTYQGHLTDGGSPANGNYDFQFKLYDALNGGSQVGSTISVPDKAVAEGLFTVQLDFGSDRFDGNARYLEIGVRPGNSGDAYTTLSPRQALTPAPYALALPGLWTRQNATSPSLIGGYSGNSVTSGVVGATIGGGGASDHTNRVTDNYGTVGGGYNNRAGDNAGTTSDRTCATVSGGGGNVASGDHATVGGGNSNAASGDHATVGGGWMNGASGSRATVGGGYSNAASYDYATVGGGYSNAASYDYATVGGGYNNEASGDHATVGGGRSNVASGVDATVGGGYSNVASSGAATVPGGYDNTASGQYSFAAGRRARANNQGCFVWGDSYNGDVNCNNENRTIFRSGGGFYIYTNSGLSSGMYLAGGGSAWNAVSNRELKENLAPVDAGQLLERLAQVEIGTWNYKAQDPAIRHIGPMADEFNGLVDGLGGEGMDHINSLDADGVALASIQELYRLYLEQKAENAALRQQVAGLQAQNVAQQEQLADLEARLAALERMVSGGPQAGGGEQ